VGVKEIADKYIGRRGGKPKPPSSRPRRKLRRTSGDVITITMDEYKRLLESTELDDMIVRCEKCGAWIDKDEPAYFGTDGEEVVGCCRYVTGTGACVAHRSPDPKD
jgi:hypothetical protein